MIYKTEIDSKTWKRNLRLSWGKDGGEGRVKEFGIITHTRTYLKMDNQQGPTV